MHTSEASFFWLFMSSSFCLVILFFTAIKLFSKNSEKKSKNDREKPRITVIILKRNMQIFQIKNPPINDV